MTESDNVAIKVSNVSKTFKLPHEKQSSIKGLFLGMFNGRRTYEKQQVLDDISFEINKGEFFGIVGRNGSGKSTLLKLLAGIYAPDSGQIQVNGKLVPFIELGVGFNPELTGRENVFLNGALLGFNRKEIAAMYDEIVEFAELKKFMDQKLKNYSSGMQVRLAFSIAIRANTEILVLDEVLAVGDANFQKKCADYFRKLKANHKTVILVSHNMKDVKEFCDRAVLVEKGNIIASGNTEEVISEYMKVNRDITNKLLKKLNTSRNKNSVKNKAAYIEAMHSYNSDGQSTAVFKPNEEIRISCDIVSLQDTKNLEVAIGLSDTIGGLGIVFASSEGEDRIKLKAGEKVRVEWSFKNIFNDGSYMINSRIKDAEGIIIDRWADALKFEVSGWEYPYALVHPKVIIKLRKPQ